MRRKPSVTGVTDASLSSAETVRIEATAPQAQSGAAMKINMGTVDRSARIVIGLALIVLTLMGTIGVWGWVGVVLVATAALGNCPLYSVLGFSTCPTRRS